MSADHPLLDQLRRTITERALLPPGARVLVAVSGGPDSLALLHALAQLRGELSIELVAGHLNHRMRSNEGEADAGFIRDTAAAWGIAVEIGSRDVMALARRSGLSIEEAGREARYRLFARAARRHGCDRVATAHTADDQAETVLLHLLRGTGLDGLAGIPYRRPLFHGRPPREVIRPLLDVTRAQVISYCHTHGLQPRSDATNASPEFLRNRVRMRLMPLLEAEYSPALRRHLLHLARLADEETAFLNEQARQLLASARMVAPQPPLPGSAGILPAWSATRGQDARAPSGGASHPSTVSPLPAFSPVRLSRQVLDAAPAPLTRRALRLALQELRPGPPPEWAIVNRLMALLTGRVPGFTLPGGQAAARLAHDELLLEPIGRAQPFLGDEGVRLEVPGITRLPWTRGAIEVRRLEATLEPNQSFLSRLPMPADQALLDEERLVGALTVRPPRPGDRIQPLGMQGHRKLHDLLTDRKVPVAVRRRLPVVCDAGKIVWVAGHGISEAAKVSPATRAALWLSWNPKPGDPQS